MFRQNEQDEQMEIMANNGPFCEGIENDKGTFLNQNCGGKKTVNV